MGQETSTIGAESALGKRLSNIHRQEHYQLAYDGKAYPLSERITIGRGPENQISLDDSLVSRQHAIIQKIQEAFFISDRDSRNGTWVNDAPVPPGKYIRLSRNDRIVVGRTELRVF